MRQGMPSELDFRVFATSLLRRHASHLQIPDLHVVLLHSTHTCISQNLEQLADHTRACDHLLAASLPCSVRYWEQGCYAVALSNRGKEGKPKPARRFAFVQHKHMWSEKIQLPNTPFMRW